MNAGAMEYRLVIKVNYGWTLRRFTAYVSRDRRFEFDLAGLRAKIGHLFGFPSDADLTLTYYDEDFDVVSLIDDSDLHEVLHQSLRFLWIDVQLNTKVVRNSSAVPGLQHGFSYMGRAEKSDAPSANHEPDAEKDCHLQEDVMRKTTVTHTGVKASSAQLDLNQDPPSDSTSPVTAAPGFGPIGSKASSCNDVKSVTSNASFGAAAPTKSSGIFTFRDEFAGSAGSSIIHKSIQCDGCGAFPITGPRFKSTVKEDYDLCTNCFSETDSKNGYHRIYSPGSYPAVHVSVPPLPLVGPHKSSPAPPKLDSCFICDVNVLDGTMMAPSTPFTKFWRLRNCGSLEWPHGTKIVCVGGHKFSDSVSVETKFPANGVPVDGEALVAVDFIAPKIPGQYISYWRMESPSGEMFGQRFWVIIQVYQPLHNSMSTLLGLYKGFKEAVKPVSAERQQNGFNASAVEKVLSSSPVMDTHAELGEAVDARCGGVTDQL